MAGRRVTGAPAGGFPVWAYEWAWDVGMCRPATFRGKGFQDGNGATHEPADWWGLLFGVWVRLCLIVAVVWGSVGGVSCLVLHRVWRWFGLAWDGVVWDGG